MRWLKERKMGTSQFQFSNPMLSELQFYINDAYGVDVEEINVNLGININKKRISDTEAIVELTVEIGDKSDNAPFYITATEGAVFRWEEDAFDKEQDIEKLLNVNAPALLLSYLRPVVSNITMFSKYPAYNIPFINFNNARNS